MKLRWIVLLIILALMVSGAFYVVDKANELMEVQGEFRDLHRAAQSGNLNINSREDVEAYIRNNQHLADLGVRLFPELGPIIENRDVEGLKSFAQNTSEGDVYRAIGQDSSLDIIQKIKRAWDKIAN